MVRRNQFLLVLDIQSSSFAFLYPTGFGSPNHIEVFCFRLTTAFSSNILNDSRARIISGVHS